MEIQPVSFGYNNQLKTLYKKGKLPTVQYDISGRKLTKKNVTLDHVIPKSKGGKSIQENYMLATAEFNHLRGNKPLKELYFEFFAYFLFPVNVLYLPCYKIHLPKHIISILLTYVIH